MKYARQLREFVGLLAEISGVIASASIIQYRNTGHRHYRNITLSIIITVSEGARDSMFIWSTHAL